MQNMVDNFKLARNRGVPLVGIETPDPGATVQTLAKALNGSAPPILQWDIINGLTGVNDAGAKELERAFPKKDELKMNTVSPTDMLSIVSGLGQNIVLFMHNAHRYYDNSDCMQGIWNLRDIFKKRGNMLVMLGPVIKLPMELERDVVVIDEPLPDDEQLWGIAENLIREIGLASTQKPKPMSAKEQEAVKRASRGLAAFPAEQAIAMSMTKAGIDIPTLWERKRKMIEQTNGLKVYNGGETFADVGGIDRIKKFGKHLFAGSQPPSAIIWIDEIEKALAGSSGAIGDSSGTSQDQLGVMLSEMQDNEWSGMILLGPPGCAKSLYAKALGATFQTPCIKADLGAMKGSLVGQSEARVRAAMKIIKAVAGRGAYWIATCNRLDSLPPELRRRFTDGIYFFDLPDEKERASIWVIQMTRYGIKEQEMPDDNNWTGADIRNVCSIAARLNIPLVEAASYITPVAKSDPKSIDRLREMADGAFLSASAAGVYRRQREEEKSTRTIKI